MLTPEHSKYRSLALTIILALIAYGCGGLPAEASETASPTPVQDLVSREIPTTAYVEPVLPTLPPATFTPTPLIPPEILTALPTVESPRADEIVYAYFPNPQGAEGYQVVLQPELGWVSNEFSILTQHRLKYPDNERVLGLVAHNYLAGHKFFEIHQGDVVRIVTETGDIIDYQVVRGQAYRTIVQADGSRIFVQIDANLDGSQDGVYDGELDGTYADIGQAVDEWNLFKSVYTDEAVTLQTCIERNGNSLWGILMIITQPVAIAQTP